MSGLVAWLDAKPHRIWVFIALCALAIAGCCVWMAVETSRAGGALP